MGFHQTATHKNGKGSFLSSIARASTALNAGKSALGN